MNLGNLIIVIFILILFITITTKSKLVKPFVLLIVLVLLCLYIIYSRNEKFITISEEKMDEINLKLQQYRIQKNLLDRLDGKYESLITMLSRINIS
jgi:predicted membrane protein